MGLSTTHGAWDGAYSSFALWRSCIAKAAGYAAYAAHIDSWFGGVRDVEEATEHTLDQDELSDANRAGVWTDAPDDPLVILLAHSDSGGSIFPDHAIPLASRLEELLPRISDIGCGETDWRYEATEQFIDGLRAAAAVHEPVTFG